MMIVRRSFTLLTKLGAISGDISHFVCAAFANNKLVETKTQTGVSI